MPENTDVQPATNDLPSTSTTIPDAKTVLDEVLARKSQVDSLVKDINTHAATAKGNSHEIAKTRSQVEKAKELADVSAAAVGQNAEQLRQQLDAAKSSVEQIGAMLASVESSGKQTAEVKAQAAAALESIRSSLTQATDASARAESLKVQIEQSAEVAATRSKHIEDGRQYVDQKRAEIDTLLNTAQQSATNAEGQHQAGRSAVDQLNTLAAAAQTAKSTVDTNVEAIGALRNQCEAHTVVTKRLAEMADRVDSKLKQYEASLAQLEQAAKERLKTIEGLLPGATSAGLASAFGLRREQFKWPQRLWQIAFLFSVLALLGVGAWELQIMAKEAAPLTYSSLGLTLAHRLPIALPLIWLALYASRQAANIKRVEEDYGHKETTARSFEGFRREMSQMEDKAALATLCANTLEIIAKPPGVTYDTHRCDVSPATALADSAKPLAAAASAFVPTIPGK